MPLLGRKLVNGLLAASLLGNAAVGSYFGYKFLKRGGVQGYLSRQGQAEPATTNAPFQVERRQTFSKIPHSPDDTVFLGDSLVANGPWGEFFTPIKNLGIGAEATTDVLKRLDPVVAHTPRTLVLLVGANDLAYEVPLDRIVANFETMVGKVRAGSPQTKLVVLGVLPVNPKIGIGWSHDNGETKELNRRVEELVRKTPNATFFDFGPMLVDKDGNLDARYTSDGIHVNIDAYLVMEAKIRELTGLPSAAAPPAPAE